MRCALLPIRDILYSRLHDEWKKERKKESKKKKKKKQTASLMYLLTRPIVQLASGLPIKRTENLNITPPPPPLRRLTRQRVKVTRCFQIYDNYSYRSYYLSNYIGSFCNPRVKTDSGTRKGKQPTYFVIILSLLYIVCN